VRDANCGKGVVALMSQALHVKYVPILRYARGEQFYPMSVDDFVSYSALWAKGARAPLAAQGEITPTLLARAHRRKADVYLRSVPASLPDEGAVARLGSDLLQTVAGLSLKPARWRTELAKVAYRWFSTKTQAATRLFWWNDLVMPLVGAGKRSASDLPRLDLPPEVRQAALDNYRHSQSTKPNYTYYYRTVRDGEYLCLQYWFFYGYNDWATGFGGMNDHEGDWEGMYIFFELDPAGRPQEPPAYVTFVGHHSRLTKPWLHKDVTLLGTHPVGYVAAGSHATYPERKEYDLIKIYGLVDYATGDGQTIGPDDWQQRVNLDAEPWSTAFMGAWGTRYWLPRSTIPDALRALARGADVQLPGISAPRGPRYADDGSVRPNWTRVVDWAGISDLKRT
jgi:hypothetical protein